MKFREKNIPPIRMMGRCQRSDKWEGFRFLVKKWSKTGKSGFPKKSLFFSFFSKKSMFFSFFAIFLLFSRIRRQQVVGVYGGYIGVYGEVHVGYQRSDKWEGFRFLVEKWSKNWKIRFFKKSMFFHKIDVFIQKIDVFFVFFDFFSIFFDFFEDYE